MFSRNAKIKVALKGTVARKPIDLKRFGSNKSTRRQSCFQFLKMFPDTQGTLSG
jgi:hypothetical protein